jgi:hypothetical protein
MYTLLYIHVTVGTEMSREGVRIQEEYINIYVKIYVYICIGSTSSPRRRGLLSLLKWGQLYGTRCMYVCSWMDWI